MLEFLTVPDTQCCDILATAGHAAAVADSFAGALAARGSEWDVLELGYLQEDATAVTAFADALRRSGCTVVIEPAGQQPVHRARFDVGRVLRRPQPEPQEGEQPRPESRRQVGCADGRLAPAGGREPSLLATMIDVSSRSWKRADRQLARPARAAGVHPPPLRARRRERQWLSVWTLALDGKPIAMEYQLVFGGQVHALRSDFDEALGEISPGSYLNRVLLERLFSGEFVRYYMGPGDNAYKLRWAEGAAPLQKLTAYSRSPRGRLAALVDLRLKPMARALRDRIRPSPPARGED